jgi:hypothetical protein
MIQESFVYHGTIFVEHALIELMLAHDWTKLHLQRPKDTNFIQCQTIFYSEFSEAPLYKKLYKNYYDLDDINLKNKTYPIIDSLKKIWPDHKLVRGEISYCPPNVRQGAHIDPRWFHQLSRRVHVPIITNYKSFLITGNDRQHLKQGEVWSFNNLIMHYGENLGTTPRIHLVFDFMDNELFKKFADKENQLYELLPGQIGPLTY